VPEVAVEAALPSGLAAGVKKAFAKPSVLIALVVAMFARSNRWKTIPKGRLLDRSHNITLARKASQCLVDSVLNIKASPIGWNMSWNYVSP